MTIDSRRSSHRVNSTSISHPGKRGEEFARIILSLAEEQRNRYQRFLLSRITEGDCIGCSPRGIAMTLNGYEVSVVYEPSGFAAPDEYCDCPRGERYRETIGHRRIAYCKQRVLEFQQSALRLFGASCLVPPAPSSWSINSWPTEIPVIGDLPEKKYVEDAEEDAEEDDTAEKWNFLRIASKRSQIVLWMEGYLEHFLFETPNGSKNGFLLRGGPGTGKTGLIRSMVPSITSQNYCMLSLYLPEFFAHLQYCSFDERTKMIEMAKNVDILFLDYLGDPDSEELAPDYIRSALMRILDHRQDKEKRTIVTTQVEYDLLEAQFGEHNFSTLTGLCALIFVPGSDLR